MGRRCVIIHTTGAGNAPNMKEVDPMKFAEYLAQTLPETTLDHLTALREELFVAGLIKSMEQKTITTETAKRFAPIATRSHFPGCILRILTNFRYFSVMSTTIMPGKKTGGRACAVFTA
jgi:hypothetical protein